MKTDTQTGYVAALAADREPTDSALPRNPLATVVAALIGPLLGLFRRRGTPTAVEKTKLETYRSTPVAAVRSSCNKDDRTITEGRPKDASERHIVAVRGYVRSAPVGRTAARKGGCRHG